jgi:hypothetical protein
MKVILRCLPYLIIALILGIIVNNECSIIFLLSTILLKIHEDEN